MQKTKIICTLGPASDQPEVLLAMMRAGMSVARLNFSHGNIKEHAARIKMIKELNQQHNFKVKILGDLEGYRLRIGSLKNGKDGP